MGQLGAGLFFDSRYIDIIKDRTGDERYQGYGLTYAALRTALQTIAS